MDVAAFDKLYTVEEFSALRDTKGYELAEGRLVEKHRSDPPRDPLMSTLASNTTLTPDDLLSMADSASYELVDGRLVEKNVGNKSGWVAGNVLFLLKNFTRGKNAGFVLGSDAGYCCFADPNKLRKPDVSFVRRESVAGDEPPDGWSTSPPELVVEVVSPKDLAYELDAKVAEYLGAGVQLVWVVNPNLKIVHVYRPRGSTITLPSLLTIDDTITGENVLPGFTAAVAEFFVA